MLLLRLRKVVLNMQDLTKAKTCSRCKHYAKPKDNGPYGECQATGVWIAKELALQEAICH